MVERDGLFPVITTTLLLKTSIIMSTPRPIFPRIVGSLYLLARWRQLAIMIGGLHDLPRPAHAFSLKLNLHQPIRTYHAGFPLTDTVATRSHRTQGAVAFADMQHPLLALLYRHDPGSPHFYSYPQIWTVNSTPGIGYRFDDIRVVPPTFARLAIHDLVHGRTTYVIRSSCDSSTNWSIGSSSSGTEGTLSTEDTEATPFWMRAGLCQCGWCEPQWFEYGWRCADQSQRQE